MLYDFMLTFIAIFTINLTSSYAENEQKVKEKT